MIVSRGADQKARGLWERDWKISARRLVRQPPCHAHDSSTSWIQTVFPRRAELKPAAAAAVTF